MQDAMMLPALPNPGPAEVPLPTTFDQPVPL